jgi:hypothetical protein
MQDTHGYLGEFPVDIKTHVVYKTHHKAWVIDQVARILLGTEVTVTEARWERHPPEYRFSVGDPSTGYVNWRKNVMDAPLEGTEEPPTEDNDASMWGWDEQSYDEGTSP